jgi:tetratricopeptide (TPR) repeat protein
MNARVVAAVIAAACVAAAPMAAGQDDPAELIKRARTLSVANDQDTAVPLFERALVLAPDSFDGHLGLGIALDERGEYARAQQHLQRAIELAPDGARERAITALAVSYAFDGRPDESATFYQRLIDSQVASLNPHGAAETANSIGRVYLESGDADAAERWYRRGYDAVMALPDLRPEQRELSELRWLNARIRIAARRGRVAEARQHLAALRALFDAMPDTATNADQKVFFPYAKGYVDLLAGDPAAAISELSRSDQQDPFVLSLIARAYAAQNDTARALEFHRKVLDIYAHNVGAAFARVLARQALAGW